MSKELSPASAALQKYFGFHAFRPLQEEIVSDVLAGRDVLALLPTGGGKSLCFQLPALLLPGVTIVVSPLIALMKDQVDALTAAGVPATFLNSTLPAAEARLRLEGLQNGQYKLLYAAPERIFMPGFLENLALWNPSLWAIDEAHCISEWGHDFRTDYRQLATIRTTFPHLPILALTATATERVRDDIQTQLQMRNPKRYVASFNRPNLAYRVEPKRGAVGQLIDYIRQRRGDSGIVYCQTRKRTEELAEALTLNGVKAAAYHAGMSPQDRAAVQEKFLRDETPVMCATIAFGMGINKPNVRYVIHCDIPRNLEGYYQETGRAGRDGLPADCLLLYSAGDVIKSERLIDMRNEGNDSVRAKAQLRLMQDYAESTDCRRRTLLAYFGERVPEASCDNCDVCTDARETWDATLATQKFLSCVYRIREKSGFAMGASHISDVLVGSQNQRVKDLGHDLLTTHGVGSEMPKADWMVLSRELARRGLLLQDPDRFQTLTITPAGMSFLKERQSLHLTRPKSSREAGTNRRHADRFRDATRKHLAGSGSDAASSHQVGEAPTDQLMATGPGPTPEFDEQLFETLRGLRKQLADDRDVPAYIILSDVALRQIARRYPESDEALLQISGIGEKKLREFGPSLIQAVRDFLLTHPKRTFSETAFSPKRQPVKAGSLSGTVAESVALFRSGLSPERIAENRKLSPSTIFGHLAQAAQSGERLEAEHLFPAGLEGLVKDALLKHGAGNMAGLVESIGQGMDHGKLKLFLALKPGLVSSERRT
ncbi:MAG: DNA helicase RecQ [Verrucomicrobia bacterium]|nr:DNA helicase RecQ [Verrucomicrobiota bacterium]